MVQATIGKRPAVERRHNTRLRTIFDTAYPMVEPFFDPAQGWCGHSLEHLFFCVLRDNFSELSSAEIHSIVVASHRVYIQRYPAHSEHLRRPNEIATSKI